MDILLDDELVLNIRRLLITPSYVKCEIKILDRKQRKQKTRQSRRYAENPRDTAVSQGGQKLEGLGNIPAYYC